MLRIARGFAAALLVLAACAPLVGCASGVDRASISYGAAPAYQAVGPQERFGLTEAAYGAATLPFGVADCALEAGGGLLSDGIVRGQQFLRCLSQKIPAPVVPVQRVQVAATASPCLTAAPLPTCAPPPARATRTVYGPVEVPIEQPRAGASACPSGACAPLPPAAAAACGK